jgi:Fic family protein
MTFEVNYKIKEEDVRGLEMISQTEGYLQVLRMNPTWSELLENRARIMEAVRSIGIEGTVLTIDQAKAITVGDSDIDVGEKERREFTAYYESLNFIKKYIDLNLSLPFLLKIHELITTGDSEANPGKIRTDQRGVKSKGKLIYKAPPPNHLTFLLQEFVTWFNKVAKDKNLSPVVAAAICHFWFVWIHPFCDGNGRVARVLTTFLLLKKKSEGVKYFALSDYYNRNKDSYYDALENTNKCDPKTPSMNFKEEITSWVSYFIKSYFFQMREIKDVANRILQLNIRVDHLRQDGLITDTHNKVLSFLSSREKASYKEIEEHLRVTKPRVHQILNPLRNARILVEEKIGPIIWFKLGAPEDEPDESIFIKKKLKSSGGGRVKTKKNKDNYQKVLPIFEEM